MEKNKKHGEVNFHLNNLDQYDLVYLSLGVGLQSSTMYYMSCIGWEGMPKIEYAAFSDPGDERQYTYNALDRLIEIGKKYGAPPIHVISKDGVKLSDRIKHKATTGERASSIPCFTKDEKGSVGMVKRQCTPDYKIEPLLKFAKRHIGVGYRQRMGDKRILTLQGITTDEATRMSVPDKEYLHNGYPLCTMRMSRQDCERWCIEHGFEVIEKSACVYCPFHSDSEWKKVKDNEEDWELAIEVDKAVRVSNMNSECFLHRSCKPLSEVDFSDNEEDLFGNACDGYCGL